MDLSKIGNFIASLRKEKKLTQIQLAEVLGVSDRTISKWERGICLPETSTIEKIIDFFDISLMEFYAGERNKKLTDEIANETIKNVVELSKDTERKKYKKLILLILSIFIIIIAIIGTIFIYNTYNEYSAFEITSQNSEYTVKGNIVLAKEKSYLIFFDLLIIDDNLSKISAYDFEYNLKIGNTLLIHNGDISSFKKDKFSTLKNLGEYTENIKIYINSDLSEVLQKETLINEELILKITYLSETMEEKSIDMKFKLSKLYSNDKIVYDKTKY